MSFIDLTKPHGVGTGTAIVTGPYTPWVGDWWIRPEPLLQAELLADGIVRIGSMRYTWNGVHWEVVL